MSEEVTNPTNEQIEDAKAALPEASAASKSMVMQEFPLEDGGTLVIASFQGAEAEVYRFGAGEPVNVLVPILEGAVPQGIQDDGTNAYAQYGAPDGRESR